MDSFVRDAFHAICDQARETDDWYVSLMVSVPYYGGPEEGGWWGSDTHVLEYQSFPSEELANKAKERIQVLVNELQAQSREEYGKQMLREMQWCEERGLDADYLPEPDGEDEYYVLVSQGVPEESRGSRHYE